MRSIENRKQLLTSENFEETNLYLANTYEEIRQDCCTPKSFKSLICNLATKSHELYNYLSAKEEKSRVKEKAKQLTNAAFAANKASRDINYVSQLFAYKVDLAHKKILQYNLD